MSRKITKQEIVERHNELAGYEPTKIQTIEKFEDLLPHQQQGYKQEYDIVDLETFHFFWSGPFSQWHKSNFKINGMQFNTAEQAMMYGKAMYFNDHIIARQVMQTKDPREQKKLGRKVAGFDASLWDGVCKVIVYNANYAKFTQNGSLLCVLMEKDVDTFVEASPYDKVWGIGLAENDPLCKSRDTWQGTNYLGEVITKVRNDIRDGVVPSEWNQSVHNTYFREV